MSYPAEEDKPKWRKFLEAVGNSICFVASLTVCFLLVSGIDLNHRFLIWLLSIGMCITTTTLIFTYVYAASMVTPDSIWKSTTSEFGLVLVVWGGLAGFVGLLFFIRFFVWGSKNCM
ncbi:hypothetical protein SESBI_14503 [Sesbania bispinosa]|nr:hypothetical protein SESBI_14503 [Sesbania bispinosa]